MSERIEELLAKMIQLQEETIKEIKINNRLLAFLDYYGDGPRSACTRIEGAYITAIKDRDI